LETMTETPFPGESENALLHALGGEITTSAKFGKIDIRLPTDIS